MVWAGWLGTKAVHWVWVGRAEVGEWLHDGYGYEGTLRRAFGQINCHSGEKIISKNSVFLSVTRTVWMKSRTATAETMTPSGTRTRTRRSCRGSPGRAAGRTKGTPRGRGTGTGASPGSPATRRSQSRSTGRNSSSTRWRSRCCDDGDSWRLGFHDNIMNGWKLCCGESWTRCYDTENRWVRRCYDDTDSWRRCHGSLDQRRRPVTLTGGGLRVTHS